MTHVLDNRFFNYIKTQVGATGRFEAYRVCHPNSTIVLFPLDDVTTPIAALTILPRNHSDTEVNTVITRRTTSDSDSKNPLGVFQAMSNTEGGEFQFVITNLVSTERPSDPKFVKIDILDSDIAVRQVDMPWRAINQVNELRSNESYVVESDQRRNNCTLILQAPKMARNQRVRGQEGAERTNGMHFTLT